MRGIKKKKLYKVEDAPNSVSEPEILYQVRQNRLTTGILATLKQLTGLKDDVLSLSLSISLKTFRNYKSGAGASMKPYLQEHVIALMALYKHGINVFGDKSQFNQWLEKPNHFFDNDQPINFFTTIGGIRYIDDRLTAIEYGDNV